MRKVFTKISNALLIACFLLALNGCNNSNSDGARYALPESNEKLAALEKEYGVTISQDKKIGLTDEELKFVEEQIVELHEILAPASYRNVKRQYMPVIKSRGESAQSSEWVFNLSWLTISASITEDDTDFKLESWLTGVTVYSYEQNGLSHNYSPRNGQKVVEYKFTAVFTIEILDKVGINITSEKEIEGEVDFTSDSISSEW